MESLKEVDKAETELTTTNINLQGKIDKAEKKITRIEAEKRDLEVKLKEVKNECFRN